MHLKRQKAPKNWPIYRKGTKYIVRPRFDTSRGIPILIVLRDMLKVAQNRKEVKRALYERNILLNNYPLTDEKTNILLFDVITIVPSKKNYRLGLTEKGKIRIEEINEKEANRKIAKIINKTLLKGKRMQLNLSDGRNFISDIKCSTNDSVLINLKERKIEKCLPLKESVSLFVFAGKHSGKKGIIKKINSEKKTVEVEMDEKIISILIKQLMVIE
ncbi:hypothetical protein FJZ20_02700 [Candidatus Pacearchaeota archaeon]|nr:hypothetical protein [Candidatus Pacearchaeota archaeon]